MSTAAASRPARKKIFDALTRYQQTFALKAGIGGPFHRQSGGANEPPRWPSDPDCGGGIRILPIICDSGISTQGKFAEVLAC